MKRRVLTFLISMLLGGLIFSSIAFASSIDVQFLPLKFFVNGEEKTTLPGQSAFILNGRTYVPLRFVAESLGCSVDWDRVTSSVYMSITPEDIPNLPKPEEPVVSFTGIWKTEAGSIYNLKQNGNIVTGVFTHYAEKPKNPDTTIDSDDLKYEFPLAGQVDGKTVELTWVYDDAEGYANIKNVPLDVAREVVGISETVSLTINQETNILEGDYYQNYVIWDPITYRVLETANGNSDLANSKLPPLKVKFFFKNPI